MLKKITCKEVFGLILDIHGVSDIGCVRELNEDSFCVYGFEKMQTPGFCLLSDGMGGHNAGEVASQKTIQFVAEELIDSMDNIKLPKALNDAVKTANKKVYDIAMENQNQRGMGATLVAAFICEDIVYIANVGDSRAYAIRDDEIVKITKDHSVVEEMVANGSLTEEEARVHPQRNIITRAVGTDPKVKTDIFEYDCLPGDWMIICSDGLSGMLEDDEIKEITENANNATDAAESLVKKAKEYGAYDNVTVICIRFIQEV